GYIRAVLERDGGGNVLWDRGLGKTTVSAAFIKKLDCDTALVVCRNDAKESVWKDQLEELLPARSIVVLPNVKAKREKCLEVLRTGGHDPDAMPYVFIVHYE